MTEYNLYPTQKSLKPDSFQKILHEIVLTFSNGWVIRKTIISSILEWVLLSKRNIIKSILIYVLVSLEITKNDWKMKYENRMDNWVIYINCQNARKLFTSNLYARLTIFNNIPIYLITFKIAEKQNEMIRKGQKIKKRNFLEK